MNPLYFGSSASPLYGVYHPPKARVGRQTGVVLCAPFGQEYMRAHRAYRQLSLLAAKAGYHVLRFDYTGSGDSAGDGEDFSMGRAVEDTGLAIEELCDMADLERVVLVGLRLGGLIATRAAAERSDVAHLVLWDPVTDGPTYLQELLLDAAARPQSFGSIAANGEARGVVGVMGYPVTETFREELTAAHMMSTTVPPLRSGLVMCTDERPEHHALAKHLAGPAGKVTFRHEPIQGRWDEVDNWGSAMIPQAAIQAIVGWLSAEVG
jgi:pimeloyl-ACP methyl ester carboxylesterase